MSNEEQDAIVGRLIREKSEAMRRKAALEAEIKRLGDVLDSVLKRTHVLTTEEIAGQLEPIRKYFNIDSYLELLREREVVQAEIVDKIKMLRELGAID